MRQTLLVYLAWCQLCCAMLISTHQMPSFRRTNRLGAPNVAVRRMASPVASAGAAVTLFSTHKGCPDAVMAKNYLDEQQINYIEHDCSTLGHEECSVMSLLVVRSSFVGNSYGSSTFRCSTQQRKVEEP